MSTPDEPAAPRTDDAAKTATDDIAKADDASPKPARAPQPTVIQGSEPEPSAPPQPTDPDEAAKATLVTARPPGARLSEVETMVFVPSDASKARREFNRYGRIEFLRDQVKRITQVPVAPRREGDKPAVRDHSMLLGFVVTLVLALAALGIWYFTVGRGH